jgi:predicted alpha/beta-fold hydrolase
MMTLKKSNKKFDFLSGLFDNFLSLNLLKLLYFHSPDSIRVIEFPLGNLPDLFYDKAFNVSRPMVIYFHGWQSGVKDASVLAMRQGYSGFNVVTVDWSAYAGDYQYLTKVIPQLAKIAETTAELLQQFLENGYDIEQLHLAGHSLG